MLSINVKITLVVIVITPLSLFVASFIAKHTYQMFKLQSETRGEQTALIDEMIGGQKVVQAYCYEDEALERFDEINDRLQKCSLKAIFYSSITNPSQQPCICGGCGKRRNFSHLRQIDGRTVILLFKLCKPIHEAV